MRMFNFHLMPYRHADLDSIETNGSAWVTYSNRHYDPEKGAGLSLFATGDFKSNPEGLNRNIEIPNLLSWITTGYPQGEIKGINNLNRENQPKYGPGN